MENENEQKYVVTKNPKGGNNYVISFRVYDWGFQGDEQSLLNGVYKSKKAAKEAAEKYLATQKSIWGT